VADFAKGLHEIVGGVTVVFDNQEAHGGPIRFGVGILAEAMLPV
jgi:hypothetical protein